mmetsp:Transcript_90753/g.282717  ORF Transcript_90753/g.282717 Transcript_90753/m.282717 type:complete len:599 (-) Transcript_90753:146-1942(-)
MLRSGAAVALLATCRAIAPAARAPEPAPLPAEGTSPEEYLRQYAGKWIPEIKNASDGGEWEDAYLKREFPAEYRQFITNWREQVPKIRNVSDGHEWRSKFMHEYDPKDVQYAKEWQRLAVQFAGAPARARDCHTLEDLKSWRDARLAKIKAFVPKAFQGFAEKSLDRQFEINKARIASEEKAAAAANSTNASQAQAAAVAFLAVPETAQQPASGMNAFASQWVPHPQAGEKPDSRANDYASQWLPHPMPSAGTSPEWYINRYAGGSVPKIRNASSGQEWREHFMSRYAEAYQHFANDSGRIQREFASAPQSAQDCHTVAALSRWREAQRAQIAAFVPKTWQGGAYKGVEGEFEANRARIAQEMAVAKAAAAKAKAAAAGSASASGPVQPVALAAVATQPAGGGQDYMNQYASQWMPPPGAGASWYLNHYAGGSVPKVQNASDWQEWRNAYMSRYAEAYKSYANESEKLSKQYADAPQLASDANTTEELEAWRSAQLAGIHAFIPKTFQSYAEDAVEAAYRANRARILEAAKAAKPAVNGTAAASPASLASEGSAESRVAAMAVLITVSSAGALLVAFAFHAARRCTEKEDVGDGYMQV